MKLIGSGVDDRGSYKLFQDELGKRWRAREPKFCKPQPFQMRFNLEDSYDASGRRRGAFRKKVKIKEETV